MTEIRYDTQCDTGCELCDLDLAEAERQRDVIDNWIARPLVGVVNTGIDNVTVTVDANGLIAFDGRVLNQAQAINVASALVEAVRLSRDRNQIDTVAYYDTGNILRRSDSPLGQAATALRKVFG